METTWRGGGECKSRRVLFLFFGGHETWRLVESFVYSLMSWRWEIMVRNYIFDCWFRNFLNVGRPTIKRRFEICKLLSNLLCYKLKITRYIFKKNWLKSLQFWILNSVFSELQWSSKRPNYCLSPCSYLSFVQVTTAADGMTKFTFSLSWSRLSRLSNFVCKCSANNSSF